LREGINDTMKGAPDGVVDFLIEAVKSAENYEEMWDKFYRAYIEVTKQYAPGAGGSGGEGGRPLPDFAGF
jgi:hypothetical protein